MRILGAAFLAAALLSTNAFAATTLSAGKPAGVQKAQGQGHTMLIIGVVGITGLGIGLAASSRGGTPTSAVTTVVGTAP